VSKSFSESSKIFSSRVRVMTWSSWVRVESRFFLEHFFCYEMALDKLETGAQHAMKWHPVS